MDGKIASPSGGEPRSSPDRFSPTWRLRIAAYGLIALLVGLAGFALLRVIGEERQEERLPGAIAVLDAYLALNRAVSIQETAEDQYETAPSGPAQERFIEQNVVVSDSLATISELGSAGDRQLAERLRETHLRYRIAVLRLFAMRDAGLTERADRFDTRVVDPASLALWDRLRRGGAEHAVGALERVQAARSSAAVVVPVLIALVALGVALVVALIAVLRRWRKRLELESAEEIARLRVAASTDSLTGLANNRSFYEDLRALAGIGWVGPRLTLVMLDLEGLKQVNDTRGHQAGDEQLRGLAEVLRTLAAPTGKAYRLGGDEFGVLLPDATAWEGAELALTAAARLEDAEISFRAGVASTTGDVPQAELTRRADLALVHAKRTNRTVELYADDLAARSELDVRDGEATYRGTLAAALAQAVDAKDSYTRSHCETVAAMCVVVAEELGFPPERIAKLRLAGLLHDVGKIGIPDAILQKPGPLAEPEFSVMKSHSALGARIIRSGGMPEEARWIRHHHERIDGGGYPDGLRGGEIPIESRVILVADAFEAMTSDRPYRTALPTEEAVAELRRHAGTQFDSECVAALGRALGHRAPAPAHAGEREVEARVS